ncbi:uncharacterized protein Pyn_34868 [Prunus yedoensis var. nudiflora]|uniref:Uncharacterized protein n=1 Tax=Prunus yedoensis var. nudiflora TaxID=2094558 RepID=A0A314XVS5_PRUYE|nr:uncharacterized protein Pyn_34868 [Prunus yedoensis var. nudiflora]
MEGTGGRSIVSLFLMLLLSLSMPCISDAYRPGDIVPMSKMGLYHSMKTEWHDMIGRHCPIFAVNREVLIPIVKPMGYTGADAYKLSFQVGREKFLIPWLFVINRKGSEVPMIEVHLRYSGSDLHGVTAKVVDMPHHYVEIHPDIRKQFWDPQHWPKHVLVRYTWQEQSEIDVTSGFYVLFGSDGQPNDVCINLMRGDLQMWSLSDTIATKFLHAFNRSDAFFILSIYVLQSSRDKLARFVRERVAESSMPAGGVAKVE